MWVQSLGWEDPLEEGMATHSNILAWRIPQTEEPGELWGSWGCKTVGHNLVTKKQQLKRVQEGMKHTHSSRYLETQCLRNLEGNFCSLSALFLRFLEDFALMDQEYAYMTRQGALWGSFVLRYSVPTTVVPHPID